MTDSREPAPPNEKVWHGANESGAEGTLQGGAEGTVQETRPVRSPIELTAEEKKSISILVIDDERTLRESCSSILSSEGYSVSVTGRPDEALQRLRRTRPHIVLVDMYMPEITGMDILAEALRANPETIVIVMTGKASVSSSIEALRAGAWNYIPKPFSATHLSILMGRASHSILVARESLKQREEQEAEAGHSSQFTLLGTSEAFRRVVQAARQVAGTDASVFITGESGTGKELIAQFIHRHSRRSSREMISINSAAMPESLLESEMFGHVKGAFTGAVRDKVGLLEAANGGTLFLDEINEMPLAVQAKLLRVVQDGVLRRLGSVSVDGVVDVRFIAATNQDPSEAVRAGKLRKDLHYRLRVFPITIPPLRERPEDITVLSRHYLDQFWHQHRRGEGPAPILSQEALAELRKRPWYGNVRQLRNVMEHTVVIIPPGTTVVHPELLPFVEHQSPHEATAERATHYPLHEEYHNARDLLLADFEQTYLRHVVRQANGNLSDAARIAGVDRTTLYRLMEKHAVDRGDLLQTTDTN